MNAIATSFMHTQLSPPILYFLMFKVLVAKDQAIECVKFNGLL